MKKICKQAETASKRRVIILLHNIALQENKSLMKHILIIHYKKINANL